MLHDCYIMLHDWISFLIFIYVALTQEWMQQVFVNLQTTATCDLQPGGRSDINTAVCLRPRWGHWNMPPLLPPPRFHRQRYTALHVQLSKYYFSCLLLFILSFLCSSSRLFLSPCELAAAELDDFRREQLFYQHTGDVHIWCVVVSPRQNGRGLGITLLPSSFEL